MSTRDDAGVSAHQSPYDYLTTMSVPEPLPITVPAIAFIKAIALNACRAKRNVQTLCRISRRACEICDTVNQQMTRASEEFNFDVIENCGNVVEKLEQLLSDVLILSTDPDESIADPQNSVHWLKNRNILNEILLSLYTDPFEPAVYNWDEDLITSRRHDDIVWIDRVCDTIEHHPLKDDNQVAISKVIGEMKSALLKAPLNSKDTKIDSAMVLATKCIMKASSVIKKSVDDENGGGAPQLDVAKGIMENLLVFVKASSLDTGSSELSSSTADSTEVDDLQTRWEKSEASVSFGFQPKHSTTRKDKARPQIKPTRKKGKEKMMFNLEHVFEASKEADATDSSDGINFTKISLGYLVSQRIKNTYVQDLHTGRCTILPHASLVVAVNEAKSMLVYFAEDDEKNYLRLISLPFDPSTPVSEIEVEGKLVHISWMQRDMIGLLNERGHFYTIAVSLDDTRPVLGSLRWLFSLPSHFTIWRDELHLSTAMEGHELGWLAFNITSKGLPKVQVWSQKSMQGAILDGIGTLTKVAIDGDSHTLLVTASQKIQPEIESFTLTVYDLDHRLPNRPFPRLCTEVPLGLKNGRPSFIHVFQPQGVAFIVVTKQHEARALLCDIHTGLKLQETGHHVTMLGTFSPENIGEENGLLVLQPGTNIVKRVTIVEEVLKDKRIEWTLSGSQ